MSGSSSSSGSSGEQRRRNRGRNVRGRTGNVRLHQLLPNEPVLAAAPPAPAPEFPPAAPAVPELHIFLPPAGAVPELPAPPAPELPPVAPALPELHLFLPPAAPAVPELLPALLVGDLVLPILPAPVADALHFLPVQVPPNPPAPAVPELLPALLVGDPAVADVLPHLPAPVADALHFLPVQAPPNPPAVYFDIPGFPEFPLEDNQGHRHLFRKLLSQSDMTSELRITGQNVLVFCGEVVPRLDVNNKCMARLTVLLPGGIIRDGHVIVRLGNLHNVASLLWQPVLGEYVVQLILQQQVFAWYKIEPDQILHIVIQV